MSSYKDLLNDCSSVSRQRRIIQFCKTNNLMLIRMYKKQWLTATQILRKQNISVVGDNI